MNESQNIVHRRNLSRSNEGDTDISVDKLTATDKNGHDPDSRKIKLTLMEEVFLLGLKDREGYTSFWNGSLCFGLRGCILVELNFRGKIKLEDAVNNRKPLFKRKLLIMNTTPTGECLLDEALKYIKELQPPVCVGNWICYLTGDSWNPLKQKYHMRNVRERIAKGLVEKGVLSSDKLTFFIFDVATHPLQDSDTKMQLVKKVQEAVLSNWVNDMSRMDKRMLSLLLLSHASGVLNNALDSLSRDDFALASKRLSELAALDLDKEAAKENSIDVMWAVIQYLCS